VLLENKTKEQKEQRDKKNKKEQKEQKEQKNRGTFPILLNHELLDRLSAMSKGLVVGSDLILCICILLCRKRQANSL